MFTSRTQWSLGVALTALVALSFAATAHAEDPCEHAFNQSPSLQVLSKGVKVPLQLGGCWKPESGSDADPQAFAGINGELLGAIAVSFDPGRVNIANSRGQVRSLDVVTGYSPTNTAPAHSATTFAYWEDQTLVFRTNGLEHDTVTVTERISLVASDTLEYAVHIVTLSQPKTPLSIRIRYHRATSIGGDLPCS